MRTLIAIVSAPVLLSACGTMSGLSGQTSFSCPAAAGVKCGSVSSVYEKAVSNSLQASDAKPAAGGPKNATLPPYQANSSQAVVPAAYDSRPGTGSALRSEPRTLRVWIAPHEDADGDLHDQQFVYLVVDRGRWLIEHNQRRIREAFAPVRAPNAASASDGKAGHDPKAAATPWLPIPGLSAAEASKPATAQVFPLKDLATIRPTAEDDHAQ